MEKERVQFLGTAPVVRLERVESWRGNSLAKDFALAAKSVK